MTVGFIVKEPARETAPSKLKLAVVALVVDQVSTVDPPGAIVEGLAVKVAVGSEVPEPTVTVAWEVTLPVELVAVKV